jgi:hypothetical protein
VALVTNEREAAEWMDRLLGDADLRERRAMLGQRKVFGEHTYEKRFEEIARRVGLTISGTDRSVSVIGLATSLKEAEALLAAYERQTWEDRELLLIFRGDADAERLEARCAEGANVRLMIMSASKPAGACVAAAIAESRHPYVALMSGSHYYGEAFLTDLMHAFQYAGTDIIGKAAHYAWDAGRAEIVLQNGGRERTAAPVLAWLSFVARKGVFARIDLDAVDWRTGEGFWEQCAAQKIKMYAGDRFNFVARRDESARGTRAGSHDSPGCIEQFAQAVESSPLQILV